MENRRYVVSFGLMETDSNIIKDKESFSKWQHIRSKVAHEIEGLIFGYCMETGIYEGYSDTFGRTENPYEISDTSLTEEGRSYGWRYPQGFQGVPREFEEKVLAYKQEIRNRGNVFDVGRFARAKKVVSPHEIMIKGIYGTTEQIKTLRSHVDRHLNRLGSKDHGHFLRKEIPVNRCRIAETIY
jgi:hypothetical protein